MKPYPSMLTESPVDGLMRIVIGPVAALNDVDDSALPFSPMRSETFRRQDNNAVDAAPMPSVLRNVRRDILLSVPLFIDVF